MMLAIETASKNEGYAHIPFAFNSVGHPIVEMKIFGKNALFLLDTGAASNLFDYEFARALPLPLSPTGQKGGGTGGILHDSYFVGSVEMTYQNHLFKFDQFFAMDFSGIKSALKAKGEKGEFHGILGFGFFKQNKCFIDYAGERIFFKT